MNEDTRASISKSQRERYERERDEARRLRDRLCAFALWNSRVWDAENADDVEAALAAVDAFLADPTGGQE